MKLAYSVSIGDNDDIDIESIIKNLNEPNFFVIYHIKDECYVLYIKTSFFDTVYNLSDNILYALGSPVGREWGNAYLSPDYRLRCFGRSQLSNVEMLVEFLRHISVVRCIPDACVYTF